jgi:cell division protein FtsB
VRLVLLGALVLIGLFYYRPLRSYVTTKHELAQRAAEVHALAVENRKLRHRLAGSATEPELVREARQLGWIRPGEKLFIVKGIEQWRRKRAHHKPATIGGGG